MSKISPLSALTTSAFSIRLRPGLEAKELESELVLHNRNCDAARRALAFYLHEMQVRGLHQALGFASAAHFAYTRLSMSRRLARDLVMVGRALLELSLIDAAFCNQRISWTKVRLLVAVATVGNEEAWLRRAKDVSCHQLEADVRGAEKGRPPREDGKGCATVKFHFGTKLLPLDYEVLQQARRKICAKAGVELNDAEVLLSLAEICLQGNQEESEQENKADSLYQVSIHQCSDCAKTHVHTEDGPIELSAGKSRRTPGEVGVTNGQKAKPTSKAMRKRVLARDGNQCSHCGCRAKLHAHHIDFLSHGGPTELSNLMTLCHRCHGMLHDGFLKVTGQAPHNIQITDQFGREVKNPLEHSGSRIVIAPHLSGARAPLAAPRAKGPRLTDLIGQSAVMESLRIACRAAEIAQRPVRHTLLCGPPGLGKTSAARAIGIESKAPYFERLGTTIESIDELQLPKNSVLFIDEIHGLPRPLAEQLYEIMDQKKICVIGATTNPDYMPKPLRDRFALQEEFLPYSVQDLAAILKRVSKSPLTQEAANIIARASLGTPRRALALLDGAEDQRLVSGGTQIDADLVMKTLETKQLTVDGLGPRHVQTLSILKRRKRPLGLTRLAGTMGIDREVFRATLEPDLLRLGMIEVTPFGLMSV